MEVLRRVRPRGQRVAAVLRLPARLATLAIACAAGTWAHAAAAQPGAPQPGAPQPGAAQRGATQSAARWPVKVREHVDLWLHAFALLSHDSSDVPIFRRGYREAMLATRTNANVFTELDANADALRTTLASRPGLLAAQFLAQEFGTWAELDAVLDAVIRSEGERQPVSQALGPAMARVAAIFRTREERDFLRRLHAGLRSEREKFHHDWWVSETRRRDAALARADSLWVHRYRPALQRFLNHTQQAGGEVILSTVLEAEGRTTQAGKDRGIVVVGFPVDTATAPDAIYALLHELVGPLTVAAVEDNVTPAEKRSGAADRLQSAALVRGGAILAARIGADAASGYMRFYLRTTGRDPGPDLVAAFAAAFPLRDGMVESIERQVAVAYSGI